MELAAWVAIALLATITVFQVALAAGAPWGAASWGGTDAGVLPAGKRIASAFAGIILYPLIAFVVLRAAGIVDTGPEFDSDWMYWLSGFFLLGTFANLVSRSPVERWWGLVSLGLAVTTFLVARG